jgi:hypothetical protein
MTATAPASGIGAEAATEARTVLGPAGPRPVTLKSSYNTLADRALA